MDPNIGVSVFVRGYQPAIICDSANLAFQPPNENMNKATRRLSGTFSRPANLSAAGRYSLISSDRQIMVHRCTTGYPPPKCGLSSWI